MIKCCSEKKDCYTDLDLVVMMDTSGSIGPEDFKKEQNFVKELMNKLSIGQNRTKVALIEFNNKVKVILDFTNDTSAEIVNNAIDKIQYRGGMLNVNNLQLVNLSTDQVLLSSRNIKVKLLGEKHPA